jgi:two-component system, cell cycle sensor histidine kinase and response regulator CckA
MTDRLPILVVDDDSQMLRTIGDILRFKGYDAVGAASGQEGLDAAEGSEGPPAIALIDLKLPDMDGIELVSRLRGIAPLVEVVILTGHASVDSAIRALREQSYDYLVKPVHPDHLVASVGRAGDRWQRRRAEQALEESELRLRRIFACVGDAVFITDDRHRIIDANPAAVSLAARSLERLRGESMDAVLEPNRASLDVRSDIFAPGYMVHSVRDLSEQRQLEAALRHAQKMEALGRLAGGVAHDFNNLLTVIKSFTEVLLSTAAPGSEDHEMLDSVKTAADSGAALTRQLLTLSRKQVLMPQVLDLNGAIQSIRPILERLLGKRVEVDVAFDRELDAIYADPGQIEQVLLNLAANARDAMTEGGRFSIRTSAAVAGSVRLIVADSGDGIPADTIDRVFEPFFTTKPDGQGTGLGLSIVCSAIEQSGGTIRVASTVGRGTTFTISFPAYHASPA